MRILKYAGLVAVLLAAGFWMLKRRQAKPGAEAPPYHTAPVVRKDLRVAVSASGVLKPLTTVDVKANVAGEITRLPVDIGDTVRAGQLLATVDPTESNSNFHQAQADVEAALARVEEAQTNLTLQRTTNPLQVKVAEQALRAAMAREQQTRRNLDLQRQTTAAQIRQAEEGLTAAKAQLASAEKTAAAQPTLTQAAIDQAEANYRSAVEALNELKNATHPTARARQKAAYEQARTNLADAQLGLRRQQELHKKGFVPEKNVTDAQVAVENAQAALTSAETAWKSVQAEQTAQLKAAEARVAETKAAVTAAKANALRDELTKQEVVAARAAVKQAEAALATARANKKLVDVREAELEAARAATRQARENLKLAAADRLRETLRAHQIAEAQAQTVRSRAQLDNAAKAVRDTKIYAPSDGVIVEKYVEEGSIITSGRSAISQGTNIVTIADITRMFVLADVDEVDIGGVKVGQPVDLSVESFSDESFSGRVAKVYPKGVEDQNVTVFQVEISLDKTDPRLRPGMTAEAQIIIAEKRSVLVVPNSALQERQGKQFVQVLVNGEPKPRPVRVGLANFEESEILSGLKEGERIITLMVRPQTGPGGGQGGKGREGQSQRNVRRMMFRLRRR